MMHIYVDSTHVQSVADSLNECRTDAYSTESNQRQTCSELLTFVEGLERAVASQSKRFT